MRERDRPPSTDRRDDEAQRGAAIYSKDLLSVYDLLVTRLSNTYVWRCHRQRILAHYDANLGGRHLDVGPGTGWYLARAQLPAGAEVTLLDLNPNSLASAGARIAPRPRVVEANVLDPLPDDLGPFDSVGANYLLHCVPGTWDEKSAAFEHLAQVLAPGGVLFGGTILGVGVEHNAIGRRLMALYNSKGVFHNSQDDVAGLQRALGRHFSEVTVTVVGAVALFRATR